MLERLLQPIKAKLAGKGGRKHTLAPLSIDESGQARFHFLCAKKECGCSGDFTIEELLEAVEEFKRVVNKERKEGGNGEQATCSEDRAA
jgi:hypothetical protein